METIAQNLELLNNTKVGIKNAIENKGVTVGDVLFEEYPLKIEAIQTGVKSRFTGHADVEGLKAIGWTDEDIEFYQINGVNWNEENDKFHKVPQENIDLYGVINARNIQTYKDDLTYLPKIDTKEEKYFRSMFYSCYSLVAIPLLDTSNGTNFGDMFYSCYSLVAIPLLDTSNGTNFSSMFRNCYSLVAIPLLDTSNGTSFISMFYSCYSLVAIPLLDTSNGTNFSSMFYSCYSLVAIPLLDTSNGTNFSSMFYSCYSVIYPNIFNIKISIDLSAISVFINKDSLLYIIDNSIATTDITIKLRQKNYDKYSIDTDVIASLSNKPFITLVK